MCSVGGHLFSNTQIPGHERAPLAFPRLCHVLWLLAALVVFCSCGAKKTSPPRPVHISKPPPSIRKMGYTIQVGAFSRLSNAVRLSANLKARGLWAFYFRGPSGLYKVRFGNYPSKAKAERVARRLRSKKIIRDYYVVSPRDYPYYQASTTRELRKNIVKTAKSFIGMPYKWGGSSPGTGFDCSGFTMAVYQLNGLLLPRSSYQQWLAGTPVSSKNLRLGDLVFFATGRRGKVSHVGIYIGNGRFIHAPSRGKRIRISFLKNPYFRPRYLGARTYL